MAFSESSLLQANTECLGKSPSYFVNEQPHPETHSKIVLEKTIIGPFA